MSIIVIIEGVTSINQVSKPLHYQVLIGISFSASMHELPWIQHKPSQYNTLLG